jgi:UDP-glucuronate decarboxylase
MVQALRNEPLTVCGDGSQTRSFCYVDDMTDALTSLMHASPVRSGPVNLGNPAEVTIRQLAEIVIELAGSKSEIRFVARPPDDPMRRQPDVARARDELDWAPKVSLRTGLEKTLAHLDELLRQDAFSGEGAAG